MAQRAKSKKGEFAPFVAPDHAERAHSALSPSGLERGMACPASVLLEDKMPKTTSVYAEEGTEAHELAETILTGKAPVKEYSPEMKTAISLYTDFVLGEVEPDDGDEYVVEYRLDLGHLAVNMFGTLDFGRWRPSTGELLVVDLKYGVGKAVYPTGPQLPAYASGLIKFFEIANEVKSIRLVIIQPRQENPIRQFVMDPLDLFDFEQDVIKAAALAFGPDPAFNPGDWCRWCKAAAGCPAMITKAKQVALDEFEGFATVQPHAGTSPDDLGEILTLARTVAGWVKAVEDKAMEEAKAGRAPTGFEWVPTRPSQKWIDESEAKRFLYGLNVPEKFFINEPTIRTPLQVKADISKVVKDEEMESFEDLYAPVSGGHKLVPATNTKRAETIAIEELSGSIDYLS